MASKFDITREMVHDKQMKIIIIRLDYAGVADLSNLIAIFDETCPGAFSNRQEVYNNQLNVNLRTEDLISISDSLSVPVNVIRKERIWRYAGLKDVVCDTYLDISQYYLCMTIMCNNNYDGLDHYLPIFEKATSAFRSIPYFQPKRLGLRKNRVENFDDYKIIASTFESHMFCLDSFNSRCDVHLSKRYSDVIHNNNVIANINRAIELVSVEGKQCYKTALDIDAYYQDDAISNERTMAELLKVANEYEFDIYKDCMTEQYLNSIM
jgi:uncharacterized protein (TIGR04255 family)